MKPTDKQIKAIDTIVSIVKTWANTNDINSPSHIDYINDELNKELGDFIRDAWLYELKDKLVDLYIKVKRIEPTYRVPYQGNPTEENNWINQLYKEKERVEYGKNSDND